MLPSEIGVFLPFCTVRSGAQGASSLLPFSITLVSWFPFPSSSFLLLKLGGVMVSDGRCEAAAFSRLVLKSCKSTPPVPADWKEYPLSFLFSDVREPAKSPLSWTPPLPCRKSVMIR